MPHENAEVTETTSKDSKVHHEVLAIYYQQLFPFRLMFQWLSHSPVPSSLFTNREIAFTLENDAYLRYQSFKDAEEFKSEVVNLNPARFEIGPVYSANPRDRKIIRKAVFKPIAKEVILDIDMSDYDDIRTCCSGADICKRCWRFISISIEVLHESLTNDFGFQDVLWVYSGRRGAHAWISDDRAMALDDSKRRAIASYLDVRRSRTTTRGASILTLSRPLHAHVSRALERLKAPFSELILDDQDPWNQDYRMLLAYISDKELASALDRKWAKQFRNSREKWHDIDDMAESGVSSTLNTKALREAKQNIILDCLYPRLDIQVSRHLNHLLKAPFCVHPKTGRICTPIDLTRLCDFDPFQVPTLTQVLHDIDHSESLSKSSTCLQPYIDLFRRFVADVVKSGAKGKRDHASLDF